MPKRLRTPIAMHEPFAVLLLDLDRFKLINDSFGHRSGDIVLNEVARRLQGWCAAIDTVARVGGDEFVLVVSPSPVPATPRRSASAPMKLCGSPFSWTASICTSPRASASPSIPQTAVPRRACSRMPTRPCIAPRNAGATIINASARHEPRRWKPREPRERAASGAAARAIRTVYQPKVDTANSGVNSAEALIRWRHPQRGLIEPAQFIPLAEECGLIHEIGAWVLREACRQCAAWRRAGRCRCASRSMWRPRSFAGRPARCRFTPRSRGIPARSALSSRSS